MRALHVFPLFGRELPNGSEHYAHRLTQALIGRGVQVDVFTTCTRRIGIKAEGICLVWPNEYAAGLQIEDGIRIFRFPTHATMPVIGGRIASDLLNRHLIRERPKLGPVPDEASPDLALYQHALMAQQSGWSNLLWLMTRGPLSVPLFKAVWSELPHYDIVLVSFFPLFSVPAVVRLARARSKPVVLLPFFHANDQMNNSRVLGDALTRANGVLSLTAHSAEYLARIHPGCRPFEVGAGVDVARLNDPGISGLRFRAKHELNGRKIVLFVGRKEAGKRYDIAIQAMQLTRDSDAVLVMVGEDVDGLRVSAERVHYLGWLTEDELWDAYDACDVFLLPSRLESFGMVFLQAWLRGKPVIGDSGSPAVRAVIDDGVDGFLCADAASIAARLDLLLADASQRSSMGEAGRRKVLEKYTWDVVAKKVRSVYETCLEDHGSSRR